MKVLIQRVKSASVEVDEECIGNINHGLLVYVGLGHEDTLEIGKSMIDKILHYRVFEDENGKLSLNVQQANGGLLLVSQFTLMAETNKGLRPDFKPAMPFATAEQLFSEITCYAKTCFSNTATGKFGAHMEVKSINDGPINFILDKNNS